jgi:hypothetical protein
MDVKGKDLILKCVDCGAEFTWYAADQEFFASKGFTQPKRCKDCRAAKKANRDGHPGNQGTTTGRFGGNRPNRSNPPR